MLQQMQKRQQNYFSQQQNKFMKTTKSEGGMREPKAAQSILDTTMRAAKLCACFSCCKRQPAQEEFLDLEQVILENDEQPNLKIVVPNSNQDKWLQYLINNLNVVNELEWAKYLV